MNLYDNIVEYISNFPSMCSVSQFYDGDAGFKYGPYRGHIKLDVAKSEICLTFELNNQNFEDYNVSLSEVGLLFLANELSSNINGVNFFIMPDTGLYLCLKKSYFYTSQEDALKFLNSTLSELSIVAEATLRIASEFKFPEISDDFYEVIENKLKQVTFEHIAQNMPAVNILLVDDLFCPGLTELGLYLKTSLHQCNIHEANKDLNPYGMKNALMRQVSEDKIDLVIAYRNGCFFAHQLTNVPKILISPQFNYSVDLASHITEYNPEVSSLPYDLDSARHFALSDADRMEDAQIFNLRFEDVNNTVGFFWTGHCSDENTKFYNMAYGPICDLISEDCVITEDIVRHTIIPAIYALYNKTHRPKYKGDVSRGEFAHHLRSIVYDKISYGPPEVYGERPFLKVCPFTHDISLEHGYREFSLEMIDKDEQIVPNEDVIRRIAMIRYPDERVSAFIDKVVSLTEPYRHNYHAMRYGDQYDVMLMSHKLNEMLLIVHKGDLSMEVRFKEDASGISKDKSVDIYPFSRFAKKNTQLKYIDISYVQLTKIALRHIQVDGMEC